MKRILILTVANILLAGCASMNTTFFPKTSLKLPPKKDVNQVEVLTAPPGRASAILGEIALGGNARCNYQTLIEAAQKKAATIGADWIVVFKTQTEYRQFVRPGFAVASGFGSGYASGYGSSWQASSRYNANGYAVGPSAGVQTLPTMNVMAGAYYPARLGIEWDKTVTNKLVIGRFSLGSKCEEAGLKKGDEVIGIDGVNSSDSRLDDHFMRLVPGQKINVTVERNGERKDFIVEAIPN